MSQTSAAPWLRHVDVVAPTLRSEPWDRTYARFEGDVEPWELPWVDLYPYLTGVGYVLRDRFNPCYFPDSPPMSSVTAPVPWQNRLGLVYWQIMDATRARDGLRVTIKAIDLSQSMRHHEWNIARIFTPDAIANDPRNHCIRILDYLRAPAGNWELLVMPQMLPYDITPFETVGEVVEFLRQVLEGLSFMHSLHVTHGDIGPRNIVMFSPDLFPHGTNHLSPGYDSDPRLTDVRRSKYRSRREVYVRYYFIDFGLSWAFKDAASRAPIEIVRGQLKDAPEYATGRYCDPFALDIWAVGRLMQRYFFDKYRLPKFVVDFAAVLTAPDPTRRPTAEAALRALDAQIAAMGDRDMNRPLKVMLSNVLKPLQWGRQRPPALTIPRTAPPPVFATTSQVLRSLYT